MVSTTRTTHWAVGLVIVALLLAGCAASANTTTTSGEGAGFWLGLWQGFITPIAFVISLFNHHVGIYEIHNSGAWYNFGYVLGLSMFFSGGARASAQPSRTRQSRDDG